MRRVLFITLGFALLIIAAWAYALHTNVPLLEPAGPIAAGEKRVMLLVVGLAAIVLIPVYIMLVGFSFAFREGNPHRWNAPDIERFGAVPEIIWWFIPGIIIFILSIVSWHTSHTLDPYEPIVGSGVPLEVQVVALDWKWLFIYPEQGIATVNLLEIPVGRAIHFTLTADAPMNSFWIPQLGGQIMVMPGMTTQLSLLADRAGVFDGYSANISGDGFSGMHFRAIAVAPAAFDAWIAQVQASSTELSHARYHELRLPSSYVAPQTFTRVFPGLFEHIVSSYMIPHMQHPTVPDDDGTLYQ